MVGVMVVVESELFCDQSSGAKKKKKKKKPSRQKTDTQHSSRVTLSLSGLKSPDMDLNQLINNIPAKVECCTSVAEKVYVGTADGQVLLYISRPRAHLLTKCLASPSRKAVERLEVMPQLGKLLCLTSNDGLILLNMYNLEAAPVASPVLQQWKSASTFAVQNGATQEYLLAVVHSRGRRIALYEYVGGDLAYEQRREIAMVDAVLNMLWWGKQIVAATKKEFSLIDTDTTATKGALAASSAAISSVLSRDGKQTHPRPLMRLIAHNALIAKENQGYMIDLRIPWSSNHFLKGGSVQRHNLGHSTALHSNRLPLHRCI